ncbi:MAG: hypothetical protein AAGC46_01330 [Solirubrobacteraceae bacterium]|nr:hypothetical protein [Patulibacter sp.]
MSSARRSPVDLPGARTAAVSFAVVIVATALSFALAQRLKRAPPLINTKSVKARTLFSPKLDAGVVRARFSFTLTKPDTITMVVTNLAGGVVRTLRRDQTVDRYTPISGTWNGADDHGKLLPDGRYRIKIELEKAGRAVLLPKTFTLDTTPPDPKLLSIGPEKTGTTTRPELLPRVDGKPIHVRFRAAGRSLGISVIRTDLTRPRTILDVPIQAGQTTWDWDGTVKGRRVAQGTYLVAVHAKDLVGNEGWSTGSADPVAPFGAQFEGQGGVTVRYLAAQSSQVPVTAGDRAAVGVISVGKQYRWSIRRVGETRPRSRGKSRNPVLQPKTPGGPSGLNVLTVATKDREAQSLVITNGKHAEPVLVVIPMGSLIGAEMVDDNGDGSPDTLGRGVTVQTARVPVEGELPADVSRDIAPLLLALDRKDRRYDLTTDLALARGVGPKLAGHKGVVLAGQATYFDLKAQKQLVQWVRSGGRLWVAEPGSLLRSATYGAAAITSPTQPARLDPFGFELGPLQSVSSVQVASDNGGLLAGTDGKFEGPLTVEPILRIPTGATRLAEATTPGGGQAVLDAVRIERGAVIRSGIAGLGAHSLRDADSREFLRRVWGFLKGG